MAQRLEWADLGPYQAYLYLIDDESPINKKVAEVTYNTHDQAFVTIIYRDAIVRDAQIDIPTKVEAMEAAMALLVANRFDRS